MNSTTAPQHGVLASFVFLLISMMLSAQAMAFDVDGLSYDVINATDVEVTGRASGNTDTDIVIPATASDGSTTYSVTSIGTQAFEDNLLTSVIIGDRVKTLEEKAFKGNLLPTVVIPNSVTTLGKKAFEANNLTVLSIDDSVTTIDLNAFNKNKLVNVVFKGPFGAFNVDTMFDNNTSLAKISYCVNAAGWSGQEFFNGSISLASTPDFDCLVPAQPAAVPLAPFWLLGIMAGLLSLVGIRKLRKI